MPDCSSSRLVTYVCLCGFTCLGAVGCRSSRAQTTPSIEFTRVPPAGEGSPDVLRAIEGKVSGAQPGQKVVLFAHSGVWWVQPLAVQPFTPIQRDATWKTSTHPGSAYAAMLVNADYTPPATLPDLPRKGGGVEAIVTAEGLALEQKPSQKLDFSGYQWEVRRGPGSPSGSRNDYDAANAWVDREGALHLRIQKTAASSA